MNRREVAELRQRLDAAEARLDAMAEALNGLAVALEGVAESTPEAFEELYSRVAALEAEIPRRKGTR